MVMFANPLSVKCPHCDAESRHNSADLLALRSVCPTCGSPFNEVGKQMGVVLDETSAFAIWAEVLLGVEDRLGILSPGIADGDVFGTKPHIELTLLDLVRAVAGNVPPGVEASGLVLESAVQVAGRPVSVAEMGLPILHALRVPHWATTHAVLGAATDDGGHDGFSGLIAAVAPAAAEPGRSAAEAAGDGKLCRRVHRLSGRLSRRRDVVPTQGDPMRLIALLMLPSLAFAAPVPKQTGKPHVELKLAAENQLVLEITIRNNGGEPLELPYHATPFEHFVVGLQAENGKQYKIQHTADGADKAEPGTLTVAAGESKTLSLHTCHYLPEVEGAGKKITFTARLKHGGETIESEPLTVNP